MRRTVVALSAAALSITLGACSPGGSPATSDNPDNSGQQQSGSAFKDVASLVSSAKSTMGEKQTVTVSFEGTGPAAAFASMKCQVDMAQAAMACTGPTEMVMTRDGLFLKSPQLAQISGDPSKPWVKMPIGDSATQQLGQLSKINDFEAMLPPGSNITANTTEQVNGKEATRYDVVTTVSQAAAAAPADQKQTYEALTASGVTELKQTVWVDSEGLPLKVTSHTPPMNVAGQQVPEMEMTMRYSDWGAPVQVSAPPANQVQERP